MAPAPVLTCPTPPVNTACGALASGVPTKLVYITLGPDGLLSLTPGFVAYCSAILGMDGVAPAGIEILRFAKGEA